MHVYVETFTIFLAFLNSEVDLKDSLCDFVVGGACV